MEKNHLDYLDGIRALAALWVMYGHIAFAVGFSLNTGNPLLAVDIFMILSGYLMIFQSLRHEEKGSFTHFVRGFYLRRIFRIAPLYYLLLLVCYVTRTGYLSLIASGQKNGINLNLQVFAYELSRSVPTLGHVLAHLSFLFGLVPAFDHSTILPDWSLSLEMQFYLIFPALLLWLNRQSIFMPSLIILLIGLGSEIVLAPHFAFPSILPLKLPFFLVGMLLAWSKWKTDSLGVRLVCLSFIILIEAHQSRALGVTTAVIVLADFRNEFAHIPFVDRARSAITSFLGCKMARLLADWSYGIYLVHFLVLIPVFCFLNTYRWFAPLPIWLRFIYLALPVTIGTLMLAIPLHYGVELPAIRWGRRLANRASQEQV